MTDMPKTKTCSICQQPYEGWGNNAYPINDGRCCGRCNADMVVPARILQLENPKLYATLTGRKE